mmetsp:Transcript_9343/g.28372  ORF Transcript_9343/g.28372 Transcript_9343/m.28372 type:complete len:505 (+) Transcript_9343:391-1905(+)
MFHKKIHLGVHEVVLVVDLELEDVLDLLGGLVSQVGEPGERVGLPVLGKGDGAEHVKLVVEDVLKVMGGVPGMARGVHDQPGVVGGAVIGGNRNRGRDSVGVLLVVLLAAVHKVDLLHQGPGDGVVERLLRVVVGGEHELLPAGLAALQGLPQEGGDDVRHRVVGGLPGGRVLLRGVADDAKGWLVGGDGNILDLLALGVVLHQGGVLLQQVEQTLDRPGALVLVQAELEVLPHDSKVVALHAQAKVERGLVLVLQVQVLLARGAQHLAGALEEPEDGLRVPEDVLGAPEPVHRPPHRQDRGLRADRRGGALGIRELLSGPNGAEGDVVRDGHADGGLDLLDGGAQRGSVHDGGRDRAVHHVVNLVGLEGKDLAEPAPDLLEQEHRQEGVLAVLVRQLGRGHGNGEKVRVPELASGMSQLRVVPEVGSVGVPLPGGGAVGGDDLLRVGGGVVAEQRDASLGCGQGVSPALLPEHGRCVGSQGQSRGTAQQCVREKQVCSLQHRV